MSDTDSVIDEYEFIYYPEELPVTKFVIILCEIHNILIHGPMDNVSPHYLVINRFKCLNINLIEQIATFINRNYLLLHGNYTRHSIIRNYSNIISKENYLKPEIAECVYLEGGECVAILKTFWIRIIQRKWKQVYQIRQQVIQRRKNIGALLYRDLTGKWPSNCLYLPSLIGLLSK